MKNLFKSMKHWEIAFITISILLVTPVFIEYLLLAFIPLAIIGMVPSVIAFKNKKYSIIILNLLILAGSLALYFYLW